MEDSVKREISKLKRLVPFKNAPDAVLEKAALKNVTLRELIENGEFLDEAEKQKAKKFFESYLLAHEFETQSDLSTLSILVWDEILIGRLKKTINNCTSSDGKSYVNDKLIKSLNDLTNHIFQIKEKLGISKQERVDEMTALTLLKKRFHSWLQENKDSCTIAVPYKCSKCNAEDVKMVFLRKVVKDWEAIDHTCFQGRFYYNKTAMDMVEAGTLSKEDYAKIFNVSIDYVNWSISNRGKIVISENKSSPDDKKA
jgi:hypothetical protein